MNHQDQVIKLAQLEGQMSRFAEDLESEKGTRARVNAEFTRQLSQIDTNQRRMERIIYMGLGGLAVLQFFLSK